MNKAILMGRLTKDPELRHTQSNLSVVSFTVAVDRRFKNANGERETDFINCVAWRQLAEIVKRHFAKGRMICVVGSLQTRQYVDKDGNKRTVTEVLADEVYFCGDWSSDSSAPRERSSEGQQAPNYARRTPPPAQPAPVDPMSQGYYVDDDGDDDDELPF